MKRRSERLRGTAAFIMPPSGVAGLELRNPFILNVRRKVFETPVSGVPVEPDWEDDLSRE